jgi:phosphoribosylformylglycinamidine cyclo-ligase
MQGQKMGKMSYARAGVDLDRYAKLMKVIMRRLKSSSEASGGGLFGGLVELGRGAGRMIVTSVDGVGTKVKVATEFGWHVGIGRDIVAHCVNDILCMGARPLAFMDYIAFEKIDPKIFKQVLRGIVSECGKHGMQLVGGETAEMPGVYREGEYDLVGFIVGLTSRRIALDGAKIRKGDLIVGLPSNGLHTNGYSLARCVLFDSGAMKVADRPPGWKQPVGRVLLKPHTSYFGEVYPLVEKRLLTGIAHVTGGGIQGNLERVLPRGCGARLRKSLWKVPKVFKLIAESGHVDEEEMFRVFNMGLGMLLIVPHSKLSDVMRMTRSSRIVGEIVDGTGRVVIE